MLVRSAFYSQGDEPNLQAIGLFRSGTHVQFVLDLRGWFSAATDRMVDCVRKDHAKWAERYGE